MNNQGHAVVETALIIVLLSAMIWGFVELFLLIWLKLAVIETAYHASRARSVYLENTPSRVEALAYWPWRLGAYLLAAPRVHWSARQIGKNNPNLYEVTGSVQADSPRFTILRGWAGAHPSAQAEAATLMSPGGVELRDSPYRGAQQDL
jgi:hypothetical protein